MRNWLLPEYVEDVLPAEASQIERLRRSLLDLFEVHGYQLVIPPMMEYLESLITGVGYDLDLATFKVVDQLTGKLMGIRADITPQTARIDAHMLNNQGVTRLCYAGSVLRTSPDGLAQTREPMQVGAELFGHAGIAGDIEIQRLMIKGLQISGVKSLHIDFNHVGIFDALIKDSDPVHEKALYGALQSKDQTEVKALTKNLDHATRDALCALTELNGDSSILLDASKRLPKIPAINHALEELSEVCAQLKDLNVEVSLDLAELRGYNYHSGIVFAAYAQGYPGPLALGGRYDEVGKSFGRARPAAGFSLDLRGLVKAMPSTNLKKCILAPYGNDKLLISKIEELRESGEKVVQELPGHEAFVDELNFDRKLKKMDGVWQVVIA